MAADSVQKSIKGTLYCMALKIMTQAMDTA